MGGHGDITNWAQATRHRTPHCPCALTRPWGSEEVPGSAQTTCGTASWAMAPATAAHGPQQRRGCAASIGNPRHRMTTGAPVSLAALWHLPITLGSMGQWGMGWGECGIVQEQGGQLGGNGTDRGSASSWLCPCQGKGFLAALLPTLMPAGFCHPSAMGWRRITAETPTGTSRAHGVTLSIPMSGTRAAA